MSEWIKCSDGIFDNYKDFIDDAIAKYKAERDIKPKTCIEQTGGCENCILYMPNLNPYDIPEPPKGVMICTVE